LCPKEWTVTSLSRRTLSDISGDVARPSYDRAQVTPGIVHFGVGGFHRAHEAVYLDSLMNADEALDWGIIGVGLLPFDRRMSDVLTRQDFLYTVVLKEADGAWMPRIIGSIIGYLFAPDDPEGVLAALCSPATRIVSMTVTEGGYSIDTTTGRFDPELSEAAADLVPGAVPTTIFGFLSEALRRRRADGVPPFTVVSCDNIQGNGDVTREALTGFAQLANPDLAEWITANVRFPNSMVDRITPMTSDDDRAELSTRFGIEDGWPVVCEPFAQWVLEDDFTDGRPLFESVGVQLVHDVEPYELMKLRLLNASHQALCYAGYLAGYRLVHEVTSDPLFSQFLLDYMTKEAIPTLKPVPGIDLTDYTHGLIRRFSNPQIRDQVARLCANSSDLIPKFLLPVLRERLAAGGSVARSTMVICCWARYAEGRDEEGAPIDVVDSRRDRLGASAHRQGDEPLAFLENRDVFGDLIDNEQFTTTYIALLVKIRSEGVRAALATLADEP
jgi:mannitol 2-dehydrogenase